MDDLLAAAPSPRLFPEHVGRASVRFDARPDAVVPPELDGIAIPARLERAVAKRRIEYLAGRTCARAAIRAVAPHLASIPVGMGESREPLWPEGIVAAITHSHGFASAAAARADEVRGIGLDTEHPMTAETARNVARKIAAPGELDALARATGLEHAALLTRVFSAKESVFKCLYPEVRRYFDFLDAEVVAIDEAAGTLAVRLLVDLTDTLRAGLVLHGRLVADATHVHTGVLLPR